jgi:hypothetical protein
VSESTTRLRVPAVDQHTAGGLTAVRVAVAVLVVVAFGTGWHFGRRWARLIGW